MFPRPDPENPDEIEASASPPESKPELAQNRKRPTTVEGPEGGVALETPETDERIDGAKPGDATGRHRRAMAPSRLGLILVAILVGSALFIGGYSLGAHVVATPGTQADQETRFGPFWDVYSLIQSDFAGASKPSPDQLVQAAIKGMMESLNDQWSYYQAPSDFQSSLLSVGGQAEGIGVQVQIQPIDPSSSLNCTKIGNGCEMAIVQPIPGSPAATAGILAGDVVVSVGGTSLDGKTIDQAIALIKGPVNTPVTLGLLRGATSIQKSVVRQIYDQPQIDTKTLANGAVAYIHVSGINPPASSQFDAALAAALAAGRHDFVLDLRGDPGGYVADAVKIASEFIPSGTICYQQDASGKTSELTATAGGRATDPSNRLVVLVDGNTASAAEILAGALQARGRAELVGAKTYGKGVVQEWLPLSNDFGGIHLTVARWLTPDKVWINGKGLLPDVPVSSSNARAGTDPVLDAGLQQLGFPSQSAALPSQSPSPSASSASSQSGSPTAAPTAAPTPVGSPS